MNTFSISAFWLSISVASTFVLHTSQKADVGINKRAVKEINKTFEVSETSLSPVLTKNIPGIDKAHLLRVSNDGVLLGYAYLGEAPSKTDSFEYLVVFDADYFIKKTKVLVYREDYGGEIGSKRWLRQFLNKTTEDRFAYRQNIAAISGATISVKSMTQSMNNLMISLASWRKDGEPYKL